MNEKLLDAQTEQQEKVVSSFKLDHCLSMLSTNRASIVLPALGKGRLLWPHIFYWVRLQMKLRWLGTPT
jgi:hypothetical protein